MRSGGDASHRGTPGSASVARLRSKSYRSNALMTGAPLRLFSQPRLSRDTVGDERYRGSNHVGRSRWRRR